jgi:polar amino acid transport system substrate-binding protein
VRGQRTMNLRDHSAVQGLSRRGRTAALLLAACLLVLASQARGQGTVPATPAAAFVMGTDSDDASLPGRWIRLIYAEAFKRMGIALELQVSPTRRISLLADEGTLDGDVLRVHGYAASHPNQVRVEMSVFDVVFSIYGVNPTVGLTRLEDLASTNLLAEYRRGVEICAMALARQLPPGRLSEVTTAEQGLRKLLAGRTDLYCENDLVVTSTLLAPEFGNAPPLRRLLDLGRSPLYPYLHKKHAALAEPLAATIGRMKAEGLIEAFRNQAERELRR